MPRVSSQAETWQPAGAFIKELAPVAMQQPLLR